MATWSTPFCQKCRWRHHPEDGCDAHRLAAVAAAKAADLQPGQLIADTPRVWTKTTDPKADALDAYYRGVGQSKP